MGGGGATWLLGWTLFHSLWQAALVAAGLALVFRIAPRSMSRLRVTAASAALLVVLALAGGTWAALDADWRQHDACWDSGAYARAHPLVCESHGVDVPQGLIDLELAATGRASKPSAVAPWAWIRPRNLPFRRQAAPFALSATAWMPLVVGLWAVLALVALVRLLAGLVVLRAVVRRSRPVQAGWPVAELERIAKRMSVSRTVGIRESDEVSAPGVADWRRPIILLPRDMSRSLEPEQLECVLAHECVHVHRRHFAANLVQRVLECLFAGNPGCLWISRRIREEREALCDDLAAGPPITGRRRYAETLLRLELLRAPTEPAYVGLLGEGQLLHRVRRLLEDAAPGRGSRRRRAGVAAIAAFGITLLVLQISVAAMSLSSWALMSRDIHVHREARRVEVAPTYQSPVGTAPSMLEPAVLP